MTDDRAIPKPLNDPGVAAAEDGFVVLDAPGMAITMTHQAAAQTGRNLIDAAAEAEDQIRQAQGRTPETPG